MGYIGSTPAAAPLTSADITDGIVIDADIKSDAAIAVSKTALVAGTGITLDTNTLNIDAAQTGITSVGTIGTGVWEATDVAVAHGGTGASTLNNLITLTTHTTGNYVATVTGGVGIDSSGATSGEGIAHSLTLDLSELTDTAIAHGDYIVFTDTTNSNASVKGDLADVATLFAGTGLTALNSVIGVDASQTQITSVGALNAGSITSGFGTIDTGSSAITTTGTLTGGSITTTGALSIASMGANWTNAGRTVADAGILTTVDINGGTIDGAVIGGASALAITGTSVTGTSIVGGTVAGTTGTFSGVLDVTDATDASDATGDTGALRTEGGASIAKKLYVGTDVSVGGDLTVSGTTTTVDSTTLTVVDPLIALASGNNSSDVVDIGIYGLYDTSGAQDEYGGLFRDASDEKWKLFQDNQAAPTTTVNTAGTGYAVGTLVATLEGNVTGDVTGDVAGNVTGNVTGNADTVTTNANLTGHVTSVGNAAVLGSFTSAQLLTALTNETGTGVAVFNTSPTLITPALGTPASGVATNLTGTAASLTAGAATVLATTRAINGVNFNGSAPITVTAAAGTLSGDTLKSTVVTSSLTAVGTIGTGVWAGTDVAVAHGGTGASTLNDLITMGTHTTGDYVSTITAGTGITSTGATSGETIAHSLSVDASQTQITAVGTIGTGVWQGTDVGVAYGGTGASTLNNLITMGTHTTGNYVATVTAGTGLTSTGATSGETIAHSLSVDAAQTGITSIYNAGLYVGRDTHNAIYFSTDNQIRFEIADVLNEIAFLAGGVGHFDGDVYAFSTTTSSDRKLKTNIQPIENALDKVLTLEGVTFDWKDAERGSSAGLIAQDVQAILPELVKEAPNMGGNDGTHLNLNYDGVVGLLVAAVIELTEKVEAK